MSTLKTLRSRIKTVKATQKITTAMKLVSAAKLRKAQEQLASFHAFDHAMKSTWQLLTETAYGEDLPSYACKQEGAPKLIVVFMADRGLCGSYNASMMRFLRQKINDDTKIYGRVDLLPIGHKAIDLLKRDHGHRFTGLLFPSKEYKPKTNEVIDKITTFLVSQMKANPYGSIHVCYTHFESVLRQTIVMDEILFNATKDIQPGFSPFFEPNRKDLIEKLIPTYIANSLRRAYLDANTSEHAARMRAMDSATNNANDVLTRLHRTYNRTRQANITRELIEIISGA
ncbi:MAG: ATP synthase F1 subunit gamma, partial [Alphaproteobacteria bacterium]|nr:ATP synthase F1 subunit gamma [Alphaproteobacteria bacterium]